MSNQLDAFMPYFKAMVEERGIDVTEGQEKGVRLLLENAVTSDKASDVCDMLHLEEGSAELYIDTIKYCLMRGSGGGEDTHGMQASQSVTCPHCGGRIGFYAVEE